MYKWLKLLSKSAVIASALTFVCIFMIAFFSAGYNVMVYINLFHEARVECFILIPLTIIGAIVLLLEGMKDEI